MCAPYCDDTGGGNPTPDPFAACTRCEDEAKATACKAENAACEGDADCRAFLSCGAACPIDQLNACVDDCGNQHQEGASTYGALVFCFSNACVQECM